MGNCFGCSKHAELMHLRALVSNYESGKEYIKIQDAHDKEVRALNRQIADLKQKVLNANCRADKYKDAYLEYRASIESQKFEEQLACKDTEINRLNTVISDLQGKITKLTAQINRDYTNSSIPSSKDETHKKICNSRERTGRKPGGQPGHIRHYLKRRIPTAPPVYIPAPENIANNKNYYPTGKIISRQVIDITFTETVIEYRTPEYRSRIDGSRYHAEFPKGVNTEVSYGSGVKAMAFLLNNYCNVSIDKVSQFISELTENGIKLSKGYINNLSEKFSVATASKRAEIFSLLQKSPCMYSDATVGRVNGKNNAVIICATPGEMLYYAREQRGKKGIEGTPAEDYQFTLVHDHDKTYYNYGGSHQECLAHVLRYLQNSIENETALTWNKKMKNLLSELIHTYKTCACNLTEEQKNIFSNRYDEILSIGEKEYEENPPSKYFPEGKNLLTRLRKYKDAHLCFLYNENVDYTNNLSERCLRTYKRKQKQAVSFRSAKSQQLFCDALSIIKTAELRKESIYQTAKNAFSYSRE